MNTQEKIPSSRPADGGARKSSPALLVGAFAIVYVVWGSTYMGIRVAIETFPPFLMAATRFLVAGSILYTVLRLRGVPRPSAAEWRDAALVGFMMLGLGNGSVTWAEQTVASNVAALIIASAPFFVALMEWLRPGGKRPAAHVALGAAVGFCGMLWLMLAGKSGSAGNAVTSATGVFACLFSTMAWSGGMMYSRYATRPRHILMAASQQMLVGGIALLAGAFLSGETAHFSVGALTLRSLVALAYLSLIGSLLTFSVYSWLIRVESPARVSTSAFVNPVVAVALGWLMLGETLSARALVAGGVIIVGVALILVPPLFSGGVQIAHVRRE